MTNHRCRRQFQRWMTLQRERALTLVSLRALNERLEDIRPALRNPPLDGYTIKLGGTDETPGVCGLWLDHYINRALAERVISEDELEAA
jgi:hypothetical protein